LPTSCVFIEGIGLSAVHALASNAAVGLCFLSQLPLACFVDLHEVSSALVSGPQRIVVGRHGRAVHPLAELFRRTSVVRIGVVHQRPTLETGKIGTVGTPSGGRTSAILEASVPEHALFGPPRQLRRERLGCGLALGLLHEELPGVLASVFICDRSAQIFGSQIQPGRAGECGCGVALELLNVHCRIAAPVATLDVDHCLR
jgi:hypothetical protein